MVFNRLAVLIALLIGALVSQLPEYAHQYKQRLGGAIDELRQILQRFDTDAAQLGMDRAQGIVRLEGQLDAFVRGRGVQMSEIAARLDRLERQMQDFDDPKPLGELTALVENFDPGVAQAAYQDFTPALPVTTGGIVSGLVGFAGGWSLLHLCAWPVRRRRIAAGGARGQAYSA